MHSKGQWQQQGDCLVLSGRWIHDDIAQHYARLPLGRVDQVDLTQVERVDSALLALLLELPPAQHRLKIVGATAEFCSLLTLYDIGNFVIVQTGEAA